MKVLKGLMLLSMILVASLSAQIIDDISEFTRTGVGYDMSDARSSAAFLDWSQFQMNHSVSMSVGASAVGSQSFLTYHNQFYMPLNSKLSFYGNLYWQLQAYASNPALQRLNAPVGDIYFDANLVYKINENTNLSIGVARYPATYGYYNSYDPFYHGGYSPYSMFNNYYPGIRP